MLNLTGKEYILDVGCNLGFLMNGVALHLTDGKVVGVDLFDSSEGSKMLFTPHLTKRNSILAGVGKQASVKYGDAKKLPYKDDTFDCVISCLFFHDLAKNDRQTAVKEMVRVTKNNGKIVFINYVWVAQEFTSLLQQYGIEAEKSFWHFTIFPAVCITYGQKQIEQNKSIINV